jgi:hypothetical protein
LSRKSIFKEVFFRIMLVVMVLAALLIFPQRIIFTSASPDTRYSLTVFPTYIQEGFNTNITVDVLQDVNSNNTYTFTLNVLAPNDAYYYTNVIVKTSGTGTWGNYTKFWSDFAGANTNLTGTYEITLYDDVGNELDFAYFTVGLTDKLEYLRSEKVNIHGSGYNPNEKVLVNLKFGNASISGFPRPVNASAEGVVTDSWAIPSNASLGVYTVTLFNATTTVKQIRDFQSFKIGVKCEVQTQNLANQPLANVTVEVYGATTGSFIVYQETNKTGWAKFILTTGNYTFKAFWKDFEVGVINKTVTDDTDDIVLLFTVGLSNIKLTVKDETSALLPFIDLSLKYNYTNRFNKTLSETKSFTTNSTGYVQLLNVFANIDYIIEARRYGLLFYTTFIRNLSGGWNDITIIVPTYTMLVQVLDSKNASAKGLTVKAYEWSSGTSVPAQTSQPTDINGNTTLSLTFGRYRVRVYYDTTFLNEVAVNLTQNPTYLIVHSDVYNVDLNVRVIDYFGQPIPNVSIELQRKIDSDYETKYTSTTGSNGVASFINVIGGDSRVYVSVAGKPSEIQYLYLVGPTREIVFKLYGYVAFAGYALDTSQFATIVILLIIIIAFIVALTYKKLPRLLHRRKKLI